jgi:pSer/pThr/pTyr-binding forkhead associated (FHA) protein/tRNA A-37 threonylcarbamoyl transferase component Bud32
MTDRKCFRLVWTQEAGPSQVFNLQKDVCVIGRQDTADIVIKHKHVSRAHARLIRQGETYTIEDLGSANGTSVDGRPLGEHEIWQLTHGSVIGLGLSITLTVQVSPEDASQPGEVVVSGSSSLREAHNAGIGTTKSDPEIVAQPAPTGGSLRVGDWLDNAYEIRQEIGQGAFGRVYVAFESALERMVAVKEVLRDDSVTSLDNFQLGRQKFEREAKLLSLFNSPYIVTVYKLIQHADSAYLVLEYAPSGSLKGLMTPGAQLPVERSLKLTANICMALVALGQRQIVHRDIKPSNILLTNEGVAKLTDFGVAQSPDSPKPAKKHPGTKRYMSPEQETTTELIDQRSDLYTLGLVLYEMLTGKLYKTNKQPARKLNSAVSPALNNVVNRALEVDPKDRYQTAQDMLEALNKVSKPGLWGR